MLSIAERHKYILDSLNKHGFVRITDVANELGVTKVTIRKDIKILESKGLLYRCTAARVRPIPTLRTSTCM